MRPFLRLAATPLLLAMAGIAVALAIRYRWNQELVLSTMLFFTLAYLALFEYLIPLDQSWHVRRDDARADLFHLALVSAVSGLGSVAAFAVVVRLHRAVALEAAVWRDVPLVWQSAVAIAVGELLPYWYHRMSHAAGPTRLSTFLWRVHAIHHIPPRLNSLKASWMHPLNTFVNTFAKMVPVLLLGVNEAVILVVAASSLVIGYLSHANIDARGGWLDYLIATPHIHHFHHSVRPEEARNYGLNIMLWDQIFGTYFNTARRVGDVGIRTTSPASYPPLDDLSRQMRFPFERTPGPRHLS